MFADIPGVPCCTAVSLTAGGSSAQHGTHTEQREQNRTYTQEGEIVVVKGQEKAGGKQIRTWRREKARIEAEQEEQRDTAVACKRGTIYLCSQSSLRVSAAT